MSDPAPALSALERRLLELVADGRSLVGAGAELSLDVETVTRTVAGLRDRFDVGSTAAVISAARTAGLIVRPRTSGEQLT
ncbi:helix-turn-helix transcriptional regulator [Kineococcus rhizosphaerae]|uniref:DNA-binding CsgD family transcriptional regulator n=1 Tax=Kineococcus rhizosphaerae TaxID=559628 RepID=A0A2T0QYE1_9ACTN|nr:helix-turn-helix transcriptional regulator [Kineococcus rhizosphaerae]PRY11395.1 DNA-binding CsgD family transcriptional regulator [Kineococcus rhizosphaerae]